MLLLAFRFTRAGHRRPTATERAVDCRWSTGIVASSAFHFRSSSKHAILQVRQDKIAIVDAR